MKKLGILALAALLVAVFTMPAAAVESEFGGYWRTRFYTNQNFTGEDDSEAKDFSFVDTRTRLYYTAIFNENLKFVNKFEFDATWGSSAGSRGGSSPGNKGYGNIGADGANIEIKNTYADFNLGPVNAKVGVQGGTLARGFLFSDDFSGAVVAFKGDSVTVPFLWIKAFEGGVGKDANDFDADYLALAPSFKVGGFSVNPYVMWAYSDDVSKYNPSFHIPLADTNDGGDTISANTFGTADELSVYYVGVDLDANFDMFSLWFTGIYEGGTMDLKSGDDIDVSAYLGAVGADASIGMIDVRAQVFYASGQDFKDDDNEINAFFVPSPGDFTAQSYYWSEIMGYGMFDYQGSNNSPTDKISNILAANIGATVKPMDKLKIALDVWYATLAEDIYVLNGNTYGPSDFIAGTVPANAKKESDLGLEVDLMITYQLIDGLKLDIVGAYLFAGDATTADADNDANPYEVGAQLSLSF